MLNVKPQKIFVSIDDSVPYVLDLINTVLTSRIILVIEENAGIISSPVSLKVLMRELSKANRIVIIQTRDRKAKKFGEIVGFVVVSETSEITEELWRDSEQGVDAFKNIYAERKESLHKRRNEVANVANLSNNLLATDPGNSLDLHEEDIDNVDVNDVIDIPIVESRLQTGFFSKNSKSLVHEKTNPEIQAETIHQNIEKIVSQAQAPIPQKIEEKPVVEEKPASFIEQKPTKQDFPVEKIQKEPVPQVQVPVPVPVPVTNPIPEAPVVNPQAEKVEIPQNKIEVEAPKVRRMSFEELYKQTKERNTLKKQSIQVEEPAKQVQSQPEMKAPIIEFVPPTPVYKRYVPKLIRTSGLVIAPGGDLRGFEEIAPEIVKDELTIQGDIIKKHNAVIERDAQITKAKYENFTESKIKNPTKPVYNTRDLPKTNQNPNAKPLPKRQQKSIFSFIKYPSKEKMAEMENIIKNSKATLGGFVKSSLDKVKEIQKNANKPRQRIPSRQQIPRDPLKKEGYKQPESRLLNRKLIKNGIRSLIIFILVFGGVSYAFLKYGTKAEVTFALTPIVISATKNITLKTLENETAASGSTSILGATDTLASETLSYSLDQGMSKETTTTVDQGKESTGSLTVYNKTDKDISLPAGTKFKINIAKKELNFLLVGNVTIPKRIIKTIRTDNGFADVRVVAEKKGADYNIPSELLGEQNRFSVAGFETSTFEAISYLGFTGGTTKLVKIVSQADHDSLKASLDAKLKEQISTYLNTTFLADYDIISKDVKFETVKEEYNGAVDQVADKVDLYMKMEGKIIAVKKKLIEQTINQFYEATKNEKLLGKTGKNLMTINEKWDHKYTIVSSENNETVVKLDIEGKIIPPVDVDNLKSQLIGLKYTETSDVFSKFTDIQEKSINISPSLVPESLRYFPQNVDAINFVFEKLEL